jgi:hypothetical protein
MGLIRKALGITILSTGLLLSYSTCTALKQLNENKKYNTIRQKVLVEINRQSLEGMMHPELSERKSSVKFSDHSFDFDNAEILKYYHTDKSDKLVIYIRDIHKSSIFDGKNLVQNNLYKTIDELYKENGTDLLVLEGTPQEEITKEWIDLNVGVLTKIIWELWYGFWTPKTKEEALEALSGGVAYEYINDTKIETCGAEDANIHEAAWYIATNKIKSEGQAWLFEKIIVEKRNEIGVEKTLKYMEKYGKKQAILVFGAAHTKGLTELLEKEGVSYIVIQPKGVDNYIYNIEKDVLSKQ